MSSYSSLTDRKVNFLQPEQNPFTGFKVGDSVSYKGAPGYTVVSTQVLNTTDAMAIMNRSTGMVTKVFGKDNLGNIKIV